jgi:transcription elongation factor GreA
MDTEAVRKKVTDLGKIIEEATVVASPTSHEFVQFGSLVRVATPDGEEEFVVVGPHEADMSKHRLNVFSGMARAVYGHAEGETASVDAPAGNYTVRVLLIAAPSKTLTG